MPESYSFWNAREVNYPLTSIHRHHQRSREVTKIAFKYIQVCHLHSFFPLLPVEVHLKKRTKRRRVLSGWRCIKRSVKQCPNRWPCVQKPWILIKAWRRCSEQNCKKTGQCLPRVKGSVLGPSRSLALKTALLGSAPLRAVMSFARHS